MTHFLARFRYNYRIFIIFLFYQQVGTMLALFHTMNMVNFNIRKKKAGKRHSSWAVLILSGLLSLMLWISPAEGPTYIGSHESLESVRLKERQKLANYLASVAPQLTPADQWTLALSVEKNATAHKIDPFLILSIIRVESNYDPHAISFAYALGLMQIRPFVARAVAEDLELQWQGDGDLYQIQWNITLGTAYLKFLLEKFDHNLWHALTAYNHGPTKIGNLLKNGSPLPQAYAEKVLNNYYSFIPAESSHSI